MSNRIKSVPIALTIAGSDSSGGAGIQADLKTFTTLGVYGASVLTAVTAQNTLGVDQVLQLEPEFVAAQFRSVQNDLAPDAVKTGMLGNASVVKIVAEALAQPPADAVKPPPVIVDPVMIATSGDQLLDRAGIEAVRSQLLPVADLITPNLPEAAVLLDGEIAGSLEDMEDQARALLQLGPGAVLLKGGHFTDGGQELDAVDVFIDDQSTIRLAMPWVDTTNTHGTGCTLSAAIAAYLALGQELTAAVSHGKTYVWKALDYGRQLGVGRGNGPVDHMFGNRK